MDLQCHIHMCHRAEEVKWQWCRHGSFAPGAGSDFDDRQK